MLHLGDSMELDAEGFCWVLGSRQGEMRLERSARHWPPLTSCLVCQGLCSVSCRVDGSTHEGFYFIYFYF